jgi:ribose-phosphate pyrophosphokinase
MNKQKLDLTTEFLEPELSDIKYKISRYPDGQQSAEIVPESVDILRPVEISSRMTTFQDLELIISATQDLYELGVKDISLYVPYFLGARSDRKFAKGASNYLKTVICPIINLQGYSKVTVLDAHSDVLEACLNHFEKIPNTGVVSFALTGIDEPQDNVVIVSPDAGALKKIYDIAKCFVLPNVITAGKVRNVLTREILKTELPIITHFKGKKFLIIDDICDGGRTFIELAKAIQEQLPDAECYLCVTHGIFSNGLKELTKYFKAIYCTNSYLDFDESAPFSMQSDLKKLFQMNVF